jgi:hypothetical protein
MTKHLLLIKKVEPMENAGEIELEAVINDIKAKEIVEIALQNTVYG